MDSWLQDAQLLAGHAARTGSLPAHSRIFEEIDTVIAARARGEPAALAPLIAEMQKVARASQVTVAMLQQRATPLGRLRRMAARATPYLLGVLTLLLTVVLAFQSSELHQADMALREHQALQGERLEEKVYLAWKMYYYEDVLDLAGPPLAQLDSYQRLVDDARRLNEKRDAVQSLLMEASVVRYLPQWISGLGDAGDAPPAASVAAGDASSGTAAPLGELKPPELDCSGLRPPRRDANAARTTKTAKGAQAPAAPVSLEEHVRSMDCFVNGLQLAVGWDYPVDMHLYQTRSKVNLLVSWLLPGLYGLLGACVFLMRDLLLGSGRRHHRGDPQIVHLLSLVLRVTLGGLAGIIIGWFWVPSSAAGSATVITVSSVPFGLAFLAGFSIESLFALLDRMNKALGDRRDPPAGGARPAEAGA